MIRCNSKLSNFDVQELPFVTMQDLPLEQKKLIYFAIASNSALTTSLSKKSWITSDESAKLVMTILTNLKSVTDFEIEEFIDDYISFLEINH